MNRLSALLESVPDDPFYQPRKPLWLPREMASAPALPPPCSRRKFRPKQMTPEELLLGYDWLYRRLFSHASVWRRMPEALSALPAYFAGCYLYKRSNRLWRFLIKHQLVHAVWRPLVELTRLRHLAFRRRLEAQTKPTVCGMPIPASV